MELSSITGTSSSRSSPFTSDAFCKSSIARPSSSTFFASKPSIAARSSTSGASAAASTTALSSSSVKALKDSKPVCRRSPLPAPLFLTVFRACLKPPSVLQSQLASQQPFPATWFPKTPTKPKPGPPLPHDVPELQPPWGASSNQLRPLLWLPPLPP